MIFGLLVWSLSAVQLPAQAPDATGTAHLVPRSSLAWRSISASRGDGRALVVADGRLVGLVTPTDIAPAVELAGLGRDGGTGSADVHQPLG